MIIVKTEEELNRAIKNREKKIRLVGTISDEYMKKTKRKKWEKEQEH